MKRFPAVGDMVGSYTLSGFLGRGACGAVFKAQSGGQDYALKIMDPVLAATPGGLARFKAEALALGCLPRHQALPGFVGLFQASPDGPWCLVMEYLEGPSLGKHVKTNGPLRPDLVNRLFGILAEGIASMHRAGVLHRDICPDNLLYEIGSNRLCLIDFGVATRVADRGVVRIEGELWQFPAPCQVHGIIPDFRADALLLAKCAAFAMGSSDNSGFPEFLEGKIVDEFARGPWGLIEPTGLSADCRLAESAEYIPDNYPLIDLGAGIRIEFARIRSGEFMMGTPSGFTGRDDDELARNVTISRSFLLSRGPVTQDQWERVMGGNPSWFRGGDLPVEQVSWHDARLFCERLGDLVRLPCRLPTEAEWEFACRAGTGTAFHFGDKCDGSQANCRGDLPFGSGEPGPNRKSTTPYGTFEPNPWGLFDMHGNVSEWCADWYGPYDEIWLTDPRGPATGKHRVLRGGSWHQDPARCRSAYRNANFPAFRGNFGYPFRVAVDA